MIPNLSAPPQPLVATDEELRLLVFGEPGVGKTTLAMTAPRPLVIDTDRGLIAAAIAGVEALTIEPQSYQDLEALYFWCRDNAEEFDSIVIDSLDELVRLLLDQIVVEGKGKKANSTITDVIPEQAEYLANQRQLHSILTEFRKLRKHMILTGGVRERDGRRTPNVTPGLIPILNHFTSVTGELVVMDLTADDAVKHNTTPGTHRVLLTKPSAQRAVKTRLAALDPFVMDPTFPEMWDLVRAHGHPGQPST
jgi:GTPase SAR1 family protein